MGSKHPSYRWW